MNSNLSAYTLCTYYGLWGSLRDEFLSRTKLLINLSSGGAATAIFEIVRVSYYLANKKAVLCQATDELLVEPDVKAVLKFCKSDELGIFAEYLLSNEKIREDYAQECYEMFVRRDLRSILEGFFNG